MHTHTIHEPFYSYQSADVSDIQRNLMIEHLFMRTLHQHVQTLTIRLLHLRWMYELWQ